MILKKHALPEGKLMVSLCDSSLLGKRIEEGNRQLDLTSNFYKGNETSAADALPLMRKARILNVVGEESVDICIKNSLVRKENVLRIGKVPYAQAVVAEE